MWALLGLVGAWAAEPPAFADWVLEQPYRADPGETAVGYHLWHELFGTLRQLTRDHPDIEVEAIGTSTEGRPLWAFHVPPSDTLEREVLVFAGIHALEWISTEVALETLLRVAVDRPEHVGVTVIPVLNPDGRWKVDDDLARQRRAYRRGNGAYVDLNRDFDVFRETRSEWAKVLPRRHASTEASLSQPESRALDALAAAHGYERSVSLHAFGGFLYYPWSGRWKRPPHWEAFVTLGQAMEAHQGARAYKTRQLARWGFFFRAQGTEIDHLYGRYGTLAFLIELTRSGIRPLKKDWKSYFRWYNPVDPTRHVWKGWRAVEALIRTELDPELVPQGPPLPADAPQDAKAP